jgi:hypothetical protein
MPEPDPGILRSRLWAESRLVRELVEAAGIQSYVVSLSNLSDAFRPTDRALRCIDRGTPGGVHLAGSGILIGLEKAQAFAQAAQAARITYHEDCGAARLWAKQNGQPEDQATEHAREFAQQLADALGVACEETPLTRPPGFHDELVVYYDGTGRADPARVSGLPKGFVISRPYFGDDFPTALEQVRLAMEIALGPHGFGELFTAEHPLRLVAIGRQGTGDSDRGQGTAQKGELTVEQLIEELKLLELPAGQRIVVDGFGYGSSK